MDMIPVVLGVLDQVMPFWRDALVAIVVISLGSFLVGRFLGWHGSDPDR